MKRLNLLSLIQEYLSPFCRAVVWSSCRGSHGWSLDKPNQYWWWRFTVRVEKLIGWREGGVCLRCAAVTDREKDVEVAAQRVSAVLTVWSSEAGFPPLVTITTIIQCPKKLVNCKTNTCKDRDSRDQISPLETCWHTSFFYYSSSVNRSGVQQGEERVNSFFFVICTEKSEQLAQQDPRSDQLFFFF